MGADVAVPAAAPPLRWPQAVALLLGGALAANSLPHLLTGMAGSPFQSPFASPPGEGLSPAPVNVAWGLANLAAAYLLLRSPRLRLRQLGHAALFAVGFAALALLAALHFGRLHGGL